MKHSSYEAVVKSFQALSIGVGGLFIVAAEAVAGPPVVKPNKVSSAQATQVGTAFETETSRWDDLAGCFHKPNRIGRSEVRNLLRE